MSTNNQNILAELRVNRLPSLPHVLVDMLDACQGNHASFQNISEIISRDAGIASRVISLANSSFYSRGTKINSLERALLVLGTDTIKTIVITASVQQFFSGFNHTHVNYLKRFWRHSLTCALTSKSLAILTSYPNPEEAYLTGLLHNIGELVLDTNYPKQFEMACALDDISQRLLKEKELFNVNHAQVGGWLTREWGLSEFAADAIEFHHAPPNAIRDAHHLVKLIYLSSQLSQQDSASDTFEIAESLFELNASLVSEIVNKINSEVDDIAKSMGVDIAVEAEEDHAKQVALAKQVRNIGLLQTAANELNRANSRKEIGLAFQSTLELLFGYANSEIFWYEAGSNELKCAISNNASNPSSATDQAEDSSSSIKFKLEPNRSLIATSAIDRKVLCSHDKEKEIDSQPIVDQQLIRHLKAESLVCIPIQTTTTLYCVLVAGTKTNLLENSSQRQLLEYFSNEIAQTCEDTLKHIYASDQEQTLEELSLRAREIAHEANNPLNIIGNYLATLANKLEDNTSVQEELTILKEEVERTGAILMRLKDLQSIQVESTPETHINDEISRLIKLYESALFLTNKIRCELELDDEVLPQSINSNSFRQILTNLIKNAVEALPENGTINISTKANVNVNGKDFTEVQVRDNGPGIDSSILKDLFQPVTSTKGKGHSGLGLSITKNLVNEAKGSISCRSSSKGTEFQILLPTNNTKAKN